VPPDGTARLAEDRLELVRSTALAAKDGVPSVAASPVVPPHHFALGFAFGVRHTRFIDPGLRVANASGDLTGILRASYGFAPRWQAVLPLAVARAGGNPDGWSWVHWGGLPVLGFTRTDLQGYSTIGAVGAGTDLSRAVSDNGALNFGASAVGPFRWSENVARQDPTTWVVLATIGYSHQLADLVTFNLAVGATGNALFNGDLPTLGLRQPSFDPALAIGSLQRRGLLPQPLIRINVDRNFTIDAYAALAYSFASRIITETYMGGASVFW
jgi:hypothetical protein